MNVAHASEPHSSLRNDIILISSMSQMVSSCRFQSRLLFWIRIRTVNVQELSQSVFQFLAFSVQGQHILLSSNQVQSCQLFGLTFPLDCPYCFSVRVLWM